MARLILVRHGQSEWNLEKRFTGWVDVDLTGQGKLESLQGWCSILRKLKLILIIFILHFS